jgi:hypothetical protein
MSIQILSREYGTSEIKVEAAYDHTSPTTVQYLMECKAGDLAEQLGTIVQTDDDGHLHVVKAVDNRGIGKEFWIRGQDG